MLNSNDIVQYLLDAFAEEGESFEVSYSPVGIRNLTFCVVSFCKRGHKWTMGLVVGDERYDEIAFNEIDAKIKNIRETNINRASNVEGLLRRFYESDYIGI